MENYNEAEVQGKIENGDLLSLDVDAYEQDDFEERFINKIDAALNKAEHKLQRDILENEVEENLSKLRKVEEEVVDIEKAFSKNGESSNKRISISLLNQKSVKVKQIKVLKEKLETSKSNLLNFDKKCCSKVTESPDRFYNTETTFDATVSYVQEADDLKNDEQSEEQPSKKFVKSNQGKENGPHSSDEEYVPDGYYSESSEEEGLLFEDHNDILDELKVPKKKLKKKPLRKKKIIDDGNFNSFVDRMRREKLSEKINPVNNDGVIVDGGFKVPARIWDKLYSYQKVGVKWLYQLHKKQVGGIIGDEMGLGKTIQMIAFLAGLDYSRLRGSNSLGAVLIVCPATVMYQWVGEIHKWWPKFRVAILHDSGSFKGRRATLVKAINNHPGVLITSYAGVRQNKAELYRYRWQYVILDEGHKIRNPDSDVTLACKQLDTPHRIIMTGTPMQNSLKELWSLFDFVFPGKLGTLPVFMTEFSVPITLGGYVNATQVQVQTAYKCSCVLRDTIGPYMLRRLKKDVKMEIELPSKNEQVLFCKLSDDQKHYYKEYINSKEVDSMLTGQLKIFVGLIKLRKICNHPDLIFSKPPKKRDDDKKSESVRGWGNDTTVEFENGYGFWKRSGKMVVVETLLRLWKQQGQRVLLFTQSKQMLVILELFVKKSNYEYLMMDGTTSVGARQNLVKKFNEDVSIFVFLLTTRVGGLGLNLIGANRIIIYDPDWNPSTDSQARERSWRIGQQKDVTIYRLMTTGTIEEKIYHRQIFKQFLTNKILTNPLQKRFFKSNDLYELFTLDEVESKDRTETSMIFAGTGSEIKFRKKSGKTDKSGQNATAKLKASSSKEGSAIKTSEVVEHTMSSNRQISFKNSLNTCMSGKLTKDLHLKQSNPKKKLVKKKKKKKVKIDGEIVDSVQKSEIYRNENNTAEEDDSKTDEKDVLLTLFRTSGIHTALKHDRIEQSDRPDYMIIEKEAERVATQAANALRKSRDSCKDNGYTVPTWTGGSTNNEDTNSKQQIGIKQGTTRKKRFGVKIETSSPPKKLLKKEDGSGPSKSTIDVSSKALLERMKNRNLVESNIVLKTINTKTETNGSETDSLLRDIHNYLLQQADKRARTDDITQFFKARIEKNDNILFKEYLKQLSNFERDNNGTGFWKLKQEFF